MKYVYKAVKKKKKKRKKQLSPWPSITRQWNYMMKPRLDSFS